MSTSRRSTAGTRSRSLMRTPLAIQARCCRGPHEYSGYARRRPGLRMSGGIGPQLLSIDDLDRAGIERILDRAESFAEVSGREIKKVPALRGRTVVNLFYEASTRTSSSFELAAKRLSADVVSVRSAGSAVEEVESLKA